METDKRLQAERWAARMDVDTFQILHTGGFLKLYLMPLGRSYWYGQALLQHRIPDWKLHFSVMEHDLGIAWDILTNLFIRRRCR